MLRVAVALLIPFMLVAGESFTFVIASPVAAQDFQMKSAAFVFRTEGCTDAQPQLSATAEGMVKGARRSVALKVLPGSKPGVYAVFQMWPSEGQWLVNLKGTCGNTAAGAIVPIGPKGFIRESSRILPRPATNSEIEASLTALNAGGRK
jgi:hypothetical protein